MRRGIAIARDYASRRSAFGSRLSDNPLHLQTLADMETEFRAAIQLWANVLILMGKSECGIATREEEILLRFLTPLSKLYIAKQSISITSESIEAMGGTGYMEDSDMPRLLRDVQVGSIWEGTTNILSLDVFRPIVKENALEIFIQDVKSRLERMRNESYLTECLEKIEKGLESIMNIQAKKIDEYTPYARYFAYSVSRIYMSLLLAEEAYHWKGESAGISALYRFTHNNDLVFNPPKNDLNYKSLAMDIDNKTKKSRGTGDISIDGTIRNKYL